MKLAEMWGDPKWKQDLKNFVAALDYFDTTEADVDLLKDMLSDTETIEKLHGAALYKLFNILLSLKTDPENNRYGHPAFDAISTFSKSFNAIVDHLVQMVLKKGNDAELKEFAKHVDVEKLENHLERQTYSKLKLRTSYEKRTPAEKKFDDENDYFVFIGRPKFVESPPGSGNHRKTLEIENLYKVDRFELADHAAVKMMSVRARFQGDGSELYAIELPKGTLKDKGNTNLPDWLVSLIDEHKRRLRV